MLYYELIVILSFSIINGALCGLYLRPYNPNEDNRPYEYEPEKKNVQVRSNVSALLQDDQTLTHIHRLNEKIVSLITLDEQQLRKLETIEYRLTKVEVQIQEKNEKLQSDVREIMRLIRELDRQNSKSETASDDLKVDVSFIKHTLEQLHGTQFADKATKPDSKTNYGDLMKKLNSISFSNDGLKTSLTSLRTDMKNLKQNITEIINKTRELSLSSKQFLTNDHFTTSLLELKHQSAYSQCLSNSHPTASIPADKQSSLPQDCKEVMLNGYNKSGVYRIKPALSRNSFYVYCDLETKAGGWMVIQNRFDGTIDFNKNWQDYKHGFGNVAGEFWIGLEKLHILTNYKLFELLIQLKDFDFENKTAHYSTFAIGSEIEGYHISLLGTYEGTAGDSLSYHSGQKFSTYDIDHDNWVDGNCAVSHTGAWWYNGCDNSNLNGRYLNGQVPEAYDYQGMYWYEWRGPSYSLMQSKMLIRPIDVNDRSKPNKGVTDKPSNNPVTNAQVISSETKPILDFDADDED